MKRVFLAVLLLSISALAQVTSPMPSPKQQFFDNNGSPLAGGKLYSYAAGSSTPLATYTDSTGSAKNTNPVVLDAAGRASVWLSGSVYKLVLKDANGVQIWSADGVKSPVGTPLSYRGAYDSNVIYSTGDLVTSSSTLFMSLADANEGNEPSLSPSKWKAFGYPGVSSNGSNGMTISGAPTNNTDADTVGARNSALLSKVADFYPGGDIGEKINAAVTDCKTAGIVCDIRVGAGGTISTAPNLPIGFSLSFAPHGTYTLSTHWKINHRGVNVYGNGATLIYSLGDNDNALYVGKGLASVVNVSGSTVTWVSGSKFSTVDPWDIIGIWDGAARQVGNVQSVDSDTQLTLSATLGTGSYTGVGAVFQLQGTAGNGDGSGRSVLIRDLTIKDVSASASDTAFTTELTSNVTLENFIGVDFYKGTCAKYLGAILATTINLQCWADGNGLLLANNGIGTFTFSQANSNRFFGISSSGSSLASGNAIGVVSGSGNLFFGLDLEGNANDHVIIDQGDGSDHYSFVDYESNGTGGSNYEIEIFSNNNVFSGPSQMQSFNSDLLIFGNNTTGNAVRDLNFNVSGGTPVAYNFTNGATGIVNNVKLTSGSAVVSALASVEYISSGVHRFPDSLSVPSLAADTGITPSSASNPITLFQKSTVLSIDLASVAAGANSAMQTQTGFSGLLTTDRCFVDPAVAMEDFGELFCHVTAADTVKWYFHNFSSGAIDRASQNYVIRILR